MRRSAVRNRPVMANSLPMTLRFYRKLSTIVVPLSPAPIQRRLKQGKEDPARIGERRGISRDVRPHGPLVWIHGASVGEVLAAAALIEKLRALNIRILLTSGTVTSAAIVAKRFPADIIHQYVPYDSPRYVARFLALAQGCRHDLGVAWTVRHLPGPVTRRCRAFYRARQPQCHYDRKFETGCSGAARRHRQAGAVDVGDARPPDHRGGVDPSRRRGDPA